MEVSQPGSRTLFMNIPLTPVRFLRYAEQQFPGKTAVVCRDHRFTYAQFGERASRLAGALREAGVKAGDRVAFLSQLPSRSRSLLRRSGIRRSVASVELSACTQRTGLHSE